MADENTAAESQAEATQQAEATNADTQQDTSVPDEVKQALKKANKEAETLRLKLKEFVDRDKTDLQRLQEERDALKSERDSLTQAQLRREVADEKGLTPAQARRLVGATREELEADADDILTAFPATPAKPKFGDVGQGPRGESANRIYTRSEISDFTFYTKNKDDILLAYKEGRIADE
jgi:hypothetical protein